MLSTNKFRSAAKDAIISIEKEHYGREDLSRDAIETVFLGYVLGNIKGTFVVPTDTQGRYYEITYSKTANQLYVDTYQKIGNKAITLE